MQYLRREGTDTIRPFADSDMEVRRRWYRAAPEAPWLPFASVFRSVRWDPFPYLRSGVGSVFPEDWQAQRIGVIQGFDYAHFCGAESDFKGEALFDPALVVEYDDEWIPLCCGRDSVCVTQLCAADEVFDRPAAQLLSFPIPHQDATGATPTFLFQRALNQGNGVVLAKAGWMSAWFPKGRDDPAGWSLEQNATDAGVMERELETIRFAPDNAITELKDVTGWTRTVEQGGVSGSLTARIVDGKLELCGVNAVICAELLPPGVQVWAHEAFVAVGTDQATAYAITKPSNAIIITSTAGAGVRLPATGTGPNTVTVLNVSTSKTFKVYPAVGDAFIPGFVANAPIDLAPETQLFLQRVATNQWIVEVEKRTVTVPPPPPPTTGTVESVSIFTGSAALTVGVTDPTVDPALTVDVDPAVDDVVALAAVDAIMAGDGAGGLASVTIGAGLDYTAGVLSAPYVYPTSGYAVWNTFAITGASGTYQATGNTLSLPAAGTYALRCMVRGEIQSSAAGVHYLKCKLRNTTAGADVANTECTITAVALTTLYGMATAVIIGRVTVGAASTIELYAARNGTGWTVSQIQSDSNGRCAGEFERVA